MKCPKCGTEFDEGIFCPECGTPISQPSKQEQSNPISSNTEKSKPDAEIPTPPSSPSEPPKRKPIKTPSEKKYDKWSMIFGIVALVTMGALIVPEILGFHYAAKANKTGTTSKKSKIGTICSALSVLILFAVFLSSSENAFLTSALTFISAGFIIAFWYFLARFVVHLLKRESKKKDAIFMAVTLIIGIVIMMLAMETDPQARCKHKYTTTKDVQPTCTEDGEIIKECSLCGKKVDTVLPATGHTMVEISRTEASETSDGSIVSKCSVCGYEHTEIIPQLESSSSVEEDTSSSESVEQNASSFEEEHSSESSEQETESTSTITATSTGFSFPKKYTDKRNKVLALIGKGTGVDVYFSHDALTQSFDGKADYTFYGNIKDGKADGIGLVYRDHKLVFGGEFKKGKPCGYGIVFDSDIPNVDYAYESGDCSTITMLVVHHRFVASGDGYIYYGFKTCRDTQTTGLELDDNAYIVYDGDLKENQKDGQGKRYFYGFDGKPIFLLYEGSYKDDECSGKGKSYYSNGQICYEGEYKKGKYNGKGTLYNEDGSVQYKGNFKDGNAA